MATIDFHCHLDLYDDVRRVVEETVRRRVYVLSVTTTPTAYEGTAALVPEGSRIRTALGLHPELAAGREHELPLFERLLSSTRYVGEVGLDGSAPHRPSLDRQAGILTDILAIAARAGGRILSLHSRGAAGLLLDLLAAEPRAGTPVLHWFSGGPRDVARAAEMGCWFSVGASMLASARGRAAVAAMPRDKLVTETDGPFGTCHGRPARPWDANNAIPVIAEVWREDAHDVNTWVSQNFAKLLSSLPTDVVPCESHDRAA